MKRVHTCLLIGVCAVLGMTPSVHAAGETPLEGLRLAQKLLKSGDVLRARQVATQLALTLQYPKCGSDEAGGPFTYIAFPPRDALHVYVNQYSILSYFDFTGLRPKRLWQMGLGPGTPNTARAGDNLFVRQFFSVPRAVVFECGVRPGSGKVKVKNLIQFYNVTPPGMTWGGTLTPKGFKVTVEHSYPVGDKPAEKTSGRGGWYQYADFIVTVPGE